MTFGENLKALRLSRHLTQQDLAKGLGVAQITISSWERGIREPNFESCESLASYFGLPLSAILVPEEKTDEGYINYVASCLHSDPKRRLLFDRSLKLTSSEMDAIINLMSTMTKGRDGN